MIEINPLNARIWSKLGQRGTMFAVAIFEAVQKHDNLMVLTADLATLSGLDRFINTYPDKFLNIGIAEQNMLGVAAGLANEGKKIFVTTYATFISMRSCEQNRHYLGYMGSDVKVVGSGAGLVMGMSGSTHQTMEDIAILRAIPNIIVISPADSTEVVKATIAAADYYGPVYLRLTGGMNNSIVYENDYDFQIGKAITLRKGSDITIIATGTMVHHSLNAAEILQQSDISASVVNMHTLKPLDASMIDLACQNSKLIVTVEEHSIIGGLGGAVAEYKSNKKGAPPQLILGIADVFRKSGDYAYMLEQNGLMPEQLAKKIEGHYRSL